MFTRIREKAQIFILQTVSNAFNDRIKFKHDESTAQYCASIFVSEMSIREEIIEDASKLIDATINSAIDRESTRFSIKRSELHEEYMAYANEIRENIANSVTTYVKSEAFIDSVIDRINRKQIK